MSGDWPVIDFFGGYVTDDPYVAEIPTSAHRETRWARALRDGLERHGDTPLYAELARKYRAEAL